MRYLHFGSVRGDLQEGHVYSFRCQLPLFGAYPRLPAHKIGVFVRGWAYGCRKIVSLRVIAKAIT